MMTQLLLLVDGVITGQGTSCCVKVLWPEWVWVGGKFWDSLGPAEDLAELRPDGQSDKLAKSFLSNPVSLGTR